MFYVLCNIRFKIKLFIFISFHKCYGTHGRNKTSYIEPRILKIIEIYGVTGNIVNCKNTLYTVSYYGME